jgi:N-acetylmuramoyl-L-alanine amidase
MGNLFKKWSKTVSEIKEETKFVGRPGMPAPKPQVYNIRDGKFLGINYAPDPELGRPMNPKGLVVHFTASYSIKGTIQWFKEKVYDIHLLIDKNGEITQMVPFNRTADHAGKSAWKGYDGLNSHFIGIEVVCLGPLTPTSDGFKDCYNRPYKGKYTTASMLGYKFWESFTKEQEESLVDSVRAIINHYGIKPEMVCGHFECSPGRKIDPGGSLSMSMDQFRNLLK